MISYNINEPLIFCHVPKMGGTSIRDVFRGVFREGLFNHYNENIVVDGKLVVRQPGKINWQMLRNLSKQRPVCIYGHMRRSEATSSDDFYPEASQFATVLRHPAEAVVSSYFFTLRKISEGVPHPMPAKSVNEWLEKVNSQMFNHLPSEAERNPRFFIKNRAVMACTLENSASLSLFFSSNFNVKISLSHINESKRDEKVDPVVLKRWETRHEKELEFYHLVRNEENFNR